MTVSSINNYYAAQAYGLDFNTLSGRTKTTGSSASGSASKQTGGTASGGISSVASVLSEVLAGMGLSANDRVTFKEVLAYRDDMRKTFEQATKEGLRKAGVDENVKFQLVSDGKGGVTVVTDSEDKAKIEKFFADNPDMVKAFNKIEALTNVEAARKSQSLDVKATRKRIEVESMTAWFAGTGQSIGSILDFSGGQSSLIAGLNKTV